MFPYRQPSDSDLRPDPRRFGSGAERDFYRPPQESFSSRSSAALAAPASQDNVLSLLTSCGLEPEDLSVLAKLPEDILTVESLPQILKQIKGKKGALQSFPPRPEDSFQQFTGSLGAVKPLPARPPSPPPSSSSFKAFSSAHWPSSSPAPREYEQLRRQPVQYPLQLIPPPSAPAESQPDRWAGHDPARSVRSPPAASASSRRPMDQDLRPRPSSYGKAGPSFSASRSADRPRPSRFSGSADYRAAPPLDERRRDSRPSYGGRARDPARDPAPRSMPSKKQALDFHGTPPPTFPYSCSLCDIVVLSEKVWIQHVNTTGHADGQLNLLQRFPRWDCRLESAGRDENQSNQGKDGPKPAPPTPRPNHNRDPQTSKKQQQKALDKGKVVCAKFPPQAVDEASLRKLIEPFGKIGKILMFPSLAFVEMGSCDQAKDLVKFYSSSDPAARKVKVEFNISTAFSFLQSSQVVSFTPAPSGEDGRSDLISIAKRFGEPLYTLFLPSKAFVEMKLSAEAQKLVDYYSSSTLRINGATIQVAFSSEYRTLMRVPSAQKYEDEPTRTKESNRTWRSRTRSRSRDRSRGGRRRRSGSRTKTRSRSRERSRTKSSHEKRSTSRERHGTSSPVQNQNQAEEKPGEPQNPESRPADGPQQVEVGSTITEAAAEEEEDQMGDEDQSTADESDIEGMEVIAEDDLESQEEENEEKQEAPAADEEKLENTGAEEEKPELQEMTEEEKVSREEQKPVTEEEEEPADSQEEEVEFPVDLESCITLDEVKSDDEDEALPADGRSKDGPEPSSGLRWSVPEEEEEMETSQPDPERSREITEMESSEIVSATQKELETPDQTRSAQTLEPEPPRTSPEPSEIRTTSQTAPETSGKAPEKRCPAQTPRRKTRSRRTAETQRQTSGDDIPRTSSEDESGPRKTRNATSRTCPDPSLEKRKGPPEDSGVPLKTLQPEDETQRTTEPEADEEENPEPSAQESGTEAAPAEGATEPEKAANPVGAEFVRPVVGYFCNLCQLIFIDEDEAKLQHCSTPAHYRKYQVAMETSGPFSHQWFCLQLSNVALFVSGENGQRSMDELSDGSELGSCCYKCAKV
ncbi:matrin 3-like 1.1 isoform 2-T2 [Anableps anableps]